MGTGHKTAWATIAVLVAAILASSALLLFIPQQVLPTLSREMKATIDLTSVKLKTLPLIGGYNYHLLKSFARYHGSDMEINLGIPEENWLDSLDKRVTDIVVMPFSDSLTKDSTHMVIPVDSAGIWVFRKNERHNAVHLVKWLAQYRHSPSYKNTRERFMGMYDPAKHTDCDFISPYDSLVRVYADTLGWDWRLLAAMIYSESHFKIEARSPRGASGLMQVMPGIASRKGYGDLLDPENNLRAGTDILLTIMHKYRLWGSPEERIKYTLASFNAGPGKVRRCVDHAIELGIDPDLWDNVATLVPTDPLDTAQTAQYLSHETVGYVRHILYLYNRYKKICPE